MILMGVSSSANIKIRCSHRILTGITTMLHWISFGILLFVCVVLTLGVPTSCQTSVSTTAQFRSNNDGVKKGNLRGAIRDFSEAIKAEPTYLIAFTNRALAKRKLHDFKGALADYDDAVRISPDNFFVLASRADTRENSGDYRGAISDYTELIRMKPNYESDYLVARARLKDKIGDTDGARADRKRESILGE